MFDSSQFDSIPKITSVNSSLFGSSKVKVSILRLDELHPQLSGNKWFKLKYNLEQASKQHCKTLVSFGGAWSNHLHALAWAGKEFGFNTVAYVRGELIEPLNPCLQDASDWGMELRALSREDYKRKDDPAFLNNLIRDVHSPYVIPEGGGNSLGIQGCSDILEGIEQGKFDCISLACGTGTTMAGILTAAQVPILGIQVLKGDGYLSNEVVAYLQTLSINPTVSWQVRDEFHRGGYARTDQTLLDFCQYFEDETSVPLEPVYSGKMFMALAELIKSEYFQKGAHILAVHGGGLQGNRGFFK